MSPCPRCSVTGRISVRRVLVAKPLGTWSLAGTQDKTVAQDKAVLECDACGFSATGRLENVTVDNSGTITGGHFISEEE